MESCCTNITVQSARVRKEEMNVTKIYMVCPDNNNEKYWHILVLPLASFITLTSYLPSLCLIFHL